MAETASKVWTILDILKVSENLLKEKNIDKARLNAELLLCDTLNTSRINLYLDFEKPLSEQEISAFRTKIKRRINREPLQYILGKSEFYGITFSVNPSVLIPRQETELLVEKTIDIIHSEPAANNVLEIGTGSGCISIAAASNIDCRIQAIDTNSDALQTAKENSEINKTGHKINFHLKNILTDFEDFAGYNIILCNPPYIPINEMDSLQIEVKDYEPSSALTDGGDGLAFYRKIISLAKKTAGRIHVLLEIGDNYKGKIEKLLKENSISNGIFYKDLLGIDRVLYLEFNN